LLIVTCIIGVTKKQTLPHIRRLYPTIRLFSVAIHSDGVFAVLEVATGEYDADVTVLAAEAAKNASERRKLPTITAAANEEVIKATSGKWQRSTNSNMSVHLTAYGMLKQSDSQSVAHASENFTAIATLISRY
jgi:hypothetical protein